MNWVVGRQGKTPLGGAGVAGEWEEGQAGAGREPGAGGGAGSSVTGPLAVEAGSRPCAPRRPAAPRGLFCTASGEPDSWLVACALWLLPQASQHPSPAHPVAGSPISQLTPCPCSHLRLTPPHLPPSLSLEGRSSSPQLAAPLSLALGPCCCLVDKCLSLPSPPGSCLLLT